MNVMEPFGGETLTAVLVHGGFLLTAFAYLFRDILWLRALAILANGCILAAALRVVPEPPQTIVLWSGAFIAINLAHSCWLIYERYLSRFSEDEQLLYDSCFAMLDRVSVRRLFRRGYWRIFKTNEPLLRQGIIADEMHLIVRGEAAVLVGGSLVSRLEAGRFVGEMSFLSAETTTALVVATRPVKCLVWRRAELEKALKQRPELRNVLYAAVGKDLARKVVSHNLKLAEI